MISSIIEEANASFPIDVIELGKEQLNRKVVFLKASEPILFNPSDSEKSIYCNVLQPLNATLTISGMFDGIFI